MVIGCKIGIHYICALAYADDVILLCPSRYGLQKMTRICEEFGVELRVTFNAKKTQCIKFGLINDTLCKPVTLNNKMINWESDINHLGNILNQKLEDGDDLQKTKGHFIGSVNIMFSNFENVQSAMLLKLFQRNF